MKTAVLASLISVASAICHYGTSLAPRSDVFERATNAFGYHGVEGPLGWHGLTDDNAICATGKQQSPINLVPGAAKSVAGSTFKFAPQAYPDGAEFENLGHGVQVWANGTATVNSKAYSLVQYHFHTPSEHHLNGQYYPAEVHFVFEAADKTNAVIGFFIEIASSGDKVNDVISSTLAKVTSIPHGGDHTITFPLDFSSLKAHIANSQVLSYSGSLTTPPCKEGIAFNVVEKPIYVSVAAFRNLKSVVKFNSRYTQNSPKEINLLDNARDILDD